MATKLSSHVEYAVSSNTTPGRNYVERQLVEWILHQNIVKF